MQRAFEPTAAVTEEPTELDRLLQKERSNPYEPTTFDEAWRLAEIVARSGMYGLGGAPEAAHIVLMAGKDLGLSQSQALQGISCIRGKAAPDARTLVAICLGHPKVCEYFDPIEQTAETATWVTKRRGRPERRYTFTIKDAEQAGLLTGKADAAWTKWPARMLSARAMAFLARDVFPDLTLGLYTAEELQSETATEVPAEIAEVAEWQGKPSDATLLDPVPPVPEMPWQDAMRAAETKGEAARIGNKAIAEDSSRRAEATEILKSFGKGEK